MTARPLTLIQEQHLAFIREYIAAHAGVSPTLREIATGMGRSLGAAYDHITILQGKGWISMTSEPRSIRILGRCSECGRESGVEHVA